MKKKQSTNLIEIDSGISEQGNVYDMFIESYGAYRQVWDIY